MVMFVPWRATAAVGPAATQPAPRVAHRELARLGWQLTVPTGAVAGRTVFEVLDLLHPLTVHHVELTPGQLLAAEHRGVRVGHDMPAEAVTSLQAKLKATHLDVVSYGPVELGADEATDRAIFAFAKQLKAKNVVASAPAVSLERLDRFANEFGVNLAIVGGPATSRYDLKSAIMGRSPRAGSAATLGADAPSAEQALGSHLVEVRVDPNATVRPSLAVLQQAHFKGVFVIDRGPTDLPQLVEALNAFSADVAAVAGDK